MHPHASIADRFCTAWKWACGAFMVGFGTCALIVNSGYSAQGLGFLTIAVVTPLVILAMLLPRCLLDIVRFVRRYRQLSAGS